MPEPTSRSLLASAPLGRLAAVALLSLAAPLGCTLQPTNPYDCEAPLSAQQPVTIRGKIQAVTAPIDFDGDGDKEVPPAGGCGDVDADHAGFQVVLRGLGTSSDNSDVRVTSQETNETGEYVFQNVPPGAYVVEFTREGFRSPPPVSVDLQCGNAADLGARCAIKTAAPAPPTLEPLPALVGSESELAVRVLGCDAALGYRLWARPQGEPGLFFDDFTADGDVCERVITLSTGDDAPARKSWRIEVTAVDALGNESAPAVETVTKDTLAPPSPDDVRAVAGPDRVFLSWSAAAASAIDDGPAGYLLSYGLVPRGASDEGACAFGRPADLAGDAHDTARFAIEGPSPLLTATPEQVLSGIVPGTELYVQVAALDAVGNLSCWSAPLLVRPDVITAGAPLVHDAAPGERMAVEGPWRAYALGSGGVALFFHGSSVGTIDQPSDDVALAGGALWMAAGAQGVARVALPPAGALPSAEPTLVDVGFPVRSLAVLGGRVLAGTELGLRDVDPGDVAGSPALVDVGAHGGPVLRVIARGPFVALVRGSSSGSRPSAVQLAVRAPGFPLLDELPVPAADVALHDGKLWIARGAAGLDVYDLSLCDPGAPAACAVLVRQGPVGPASAVARLTAWDDVVLVGADATGEDAATGGLFFFRTTGDAGIQQVGRVPHGPAATVHGVEARAGEVCLTVRAGGETRHECSSTVQFPVVGESRSLTHDRLVQEVLVDGADVWSLERAPGGTYELVQRALTSGALRSRTFLDQTEVAPGVLEGAAGSVALIAAAAVPNLGALALDNGGRLYFAPLDGNDGPLARVDDDWPGKVLLADPGLGSPAVDVDVDVLALRKAEMMFTGAEVLVVAHTAGNPGEDGCFPLVALRAPLLADASGQVTVGAPALARLGDVWELGPLRAHGGVALVPVHPFGVLSATTSGSLEGGVAVALDETCRDPGAGGGALSGAQALEVVSDGEGLSLLLSGQRFVSGGLESPGLYALADEELARVPLAFTTSLFDLHRVGAFVLAHTNGQGALLLRIPGAEAAEPLVPSLSLPSIPTPLRSKATGRGVLVAGGSGGLRWSVLR